MMMHDAGKATAMVKKSRNSAAQLALFSCLAVFTTGQSFLIVVLPPLGRRLEFPDLYVGGILSLSALLIMVSAPAWGYLSERIGRCRIMLVALCGATLSAIGIGIVIHFRLSGAISVLSALLLIAVIRAFQALITSGILPAAQAYMADITEPKNRATGMGILGAAIGVGTIMGAALAWRVAGNNPVLAFLLVALLAVLAFSGVLLLTKEPVRTLATIGRDTPLPIGKLWPFLAITLVSMCAYSMLQQVTALRLQDSLGFTVGESISQAGAALMATALAMIIVQTVAVRIFRWSPIRLLHVGSSLAVIAMLISSFVTSYLAIFATLILLGIGLGLMLTGNLASLSLCAGQRAQGKAAGINVLAAGLGQAVGPIAGASLHHISPQAPFVTASILFACAYLAVARAQTGEASLLVSTRK